VFKIVNLTIEAYAPLLPSITYFFLLASPLNRDSNELTKNILRDDNSLLCQSEALPEGERMEFILFTFYMGKASQNNLQSTVRRFEEERERERERERKETNWQQNNLLEP